MIKKSKNTIDDLARMVQDGFSEINDRFNKGFEEVSERLGSIEGRLDVIEIELIDIKKKLENIIYRHELEILKDRVTHLEHILQSKKK